jgi:hypothetical protein
MIFNWRLPGGRGYTFECRRGADKLLIFIERPCKKAAINTSPISNNLEN